MEGESGVTQSITDDFHSSDIERDQMEDGSGVTRSIIDEVHSWDMEGEQIEGEGDGTRNIIDQLFLGISKQIKRKVKVLLLEVSLMNFLLGISKEIK